MQTQAQPRLNGSLAGTRSLRASKQLFRGAPVAARPSPFRAGARRHGMDVVRAEKVRPWAAVHVARALLVA